MVPIVIIYKISVTILESNFLDTGNYKRPSTYIQGYPRVLTGSLHSTAHTMGNQTKIPTHTRTSLRKTEYEYQAQSYSWGPDPAGCPSLRGHQAHSFWTPEREG